MALTDFISALLWYFWEYRFAVLLIVVGGIVILYTAHKGRRGTSSQSVPTADPRFAGFAFMMDMRENLLKLPLSKRIFLIVIMFTLGIFLGAVVAPHNFIVNTHEAENLETSGTLSYTRIDTAIDPVKRNLGVRLLYETIPMCDSTTTTDVFLITTGDGASYRADCKGVDDHVYREPGMYTSQYLRNGVVIAEVVIDVSKPLP